MAETSRVQRKLAETKMENVLARLGLPLTVTWTPNRSHNKHGEIVSGTILIFDHDEREAWLTFEHEVLEYRLKAVSDVYREMVNCLIEAFERLAYKRKEEFLEAIPNIFKVIEEENKLA